MYPYYWKYVHVGIQIGLDYITEKIEYKIATKYFLFFQSSEPLATSSRGEFIEFITIKRGNNVPKNSQLKHNKINIKINCCNNSRLVKDEPIFLCHNL